MKRLLVLALLSVVLTGCVKQEDYNKLAEEYEKLQVDYDELNKDYQFEKERPEWVDLFDKEYSYEDGSINTTISLSDTNMTTLSVTLNDSSNDKSNTYYEELINFTVSYFYALYLDTTIDTYIFRVNFENRDDYLSTFNLIAKEHTSITIDAYNRDFSLTFGEKPDWITDATASDVSYMEWLMPILDQYKTDSQYYIDFIERYNNDH